MNIYALLYYVCIFFSLRSCYALVSIVPLLFPSAGILHIFMEMKGLSYKVINVTWDDDMMIG